MENREDTILFLLLPPHKRSVSNPQKVTLTPL